MTIEGPGEKHGTKNKDKKSSMVSSVGKALRHTATRVGLSVAALVGGGTIAAKKAGLFEGPDYTNRSEVKLQRVLTKEITDVYEGLKYLSEDEKSLASAVHHDLKAVEGYLEKVRTGSPTGNVEFHLDSVRQALSDLSTRNLSLKDKSLAQFVDDYQKKFADISAQAKDVIGSKKRDTGGQYI